MQDDFLGARDVVEGQSGNVLAALAVANGTAAENGERLAYFRQMSDEYVSLRNAGVLAIFASVVVCGAAGVIGIAAGLTNIKSCTPCERGGNNQRHICRADCGRCVTVVAIIGPSA